MKGRFWVWTTVAWLSLLLPITGSSEPLPDLVGEWLSFSVSQGKDTTVKGVFQVSNIGSGKASGFTVKFWESKDQVIDTGDTLIKTQNVGSLNPGSVKKLNFSYKPKAPFPGYVIAEIDAGHQVSEIVDTNNIISSHLDAGFNTPKEGAEAAEKLFQIFHTVLSNSEIFRGIVDFGRNPLDLVKTGLKAGPSPSIARTDLPCPEGGQIHLSDAEASFEGCKVSCPKGGSDLIDGKMSRNGGTANLTQRFSSCEIQDFLSDGLAVLQIATASSQLNLSSHFGEPGVPFQILYDPDNTLVQTEGLDFSLSTNKNRPDAAVSWVMNGQLSVVDLKEASNSRLTYQYDSLRGSYSRKISGDGSTEVHTLNGRVTRSGTEGETAQQVCFYLENVQIEAQTLAGSAVSRINGKIYLDCTPDCAVEGTLEFITEEAIQYNLSEGHTTAGKVVLQYNGLPLAKVEFHEDGSVTVTVGVKSETFTPGAYQLWL